jgi:hypothetical protein
MNSFSALVLTGLVSVAAISIPFATGCGMDVGVSGATGTGGHASGAGGGCSGAVTSGGMGGVESASASTGGDTTVSTSSVGSGGSGAVCGGDTANLCAANEYCDFPGNSCGFADEVGTCKPRPMACDAVYIPTCGCDGKIYGNDCTANGAGHDVAPAGTCPAPVGMFACGEHFCDPKTSYCQQQISDVGNQPTTYACLALPAGCGASPSCGCLAAEPCSNACTMVNGGGLQLSCPGG